MSTTANTVPFLDLRAQIEPLRAEIMEAVGGVIDQCAFAGGPAVDRFERDFANAFGHAHVVGVGSGTEAIWVALLALGIGPDDEVITVPNSFIATAEAISFCGATPVFVDVDERTYTMDPALLERAITPRTRAIVPVHLFGQMADMDPILAIAERHGIPVVEDAAQAQGAEYRGSPAGSMGRAGCFSFYPGKNLGAWGEAGAVTTSDEALAGWIRSFRDHGQTEKHRHDLVGWNARMDGIQGAVLSVKLPHLEAWTEARRRNAALYSELLADVPGVIAPTEAPHRKHVYHLYVIRVPDRDGMLAALRERGVHGGMHYPTSIHLQKAYRDLPYGPGSFPVAAALARDGLSLPMYPELPEEQVRYVADAVAEVLGEP